MNVWFVSSLLGDKSVFGFCYERNIIGTNMDLQAAWDAFADDFPGEKPAEALPLQDPSQALLAMKKSDFVWAQNSKKDGGDGRIYLGKIPPTRKSQSGQKAKTPRKNESGQNIKPYQETDAEKHSLWKHRESQPNWAEREEYKHAGVIYSLFCPLYAVRASDRSKSDPGVFRLLSNRIPTFDIRYTDEKKFVQLTERIWNRIEKQVKAKQR